jgi:micrococcal nuclease
VQGPRKAPGVRSRAGSLLLIVLAAVVAGGIVAIRRDRGGNGSAPVLRVIDGDTFTALVGGTAQRVRVIGIDTPEVAHGGAPAACFGDQARRFAQAFLGGRTVVLVPGPEPRDRYGRLLARVEVGGVDYSRELARRGLARTLAIPPDTSDAPELQRLVAAARRARTGLWGACGFASAFPGK